MATDYQPDIVVSAGSFQGPNLTYIVLGVGLTVSVLLLLALILGLWIYCARRAGNLAEKTGAPIKYSLPRGSMTVRILPDEIPGTQIPAKQ